MYEPGAPIKVACCSVSPSLVCAQWTFHLESSAPIQYDHEVKLETLCSRPKIAVFLSELWALPDPSGTHDLMCLHIWKVLDI